MVGPGPPGGLWKARWRGAHVCTVDLGVLAAATVCRSGQFVRWFPQRVAAPRGQQWVVGRLGIFSSQHRARPEPASRTVTGNCRGLRRLPPDPPAARGLTDSTIHSAAAFSKGRGGKMSFKKIVIWTFCLGKEQGLTSFQLLF